MIIITVLDSVLTESNLTLWIIDLLEHLGLITSALILQPAGAERADDTFSDLSV